MKIKKTIMGLPILCLLVLSCQKDNPDSGISKGSLSINIGLFVSVNEIENNLKSTYAGEDFKVVVYKTGGEEVLRYERADEIPAQVELDPGEYYVVAYSDNNLPAAFNNPYYYGRSLPFIISPSAVQSVTVNCELANTIVSLVYAEEVIANFIDYKTTVSSTAGSLVFTKGETRSGYFQPLPLTIHVELIKQIPGGLTDTIKLTGNIPNPQPQKRYEIHIDNPVTVGSAAFTIVLDETLDPVEIIHINGNGSFSGVFNYGDLLITEILYDPVNLGDSEGEWFEIYNNANYPVDLNQVVIRKNDTEQHVIDSSIILESHKYCILAKTKSACSTSKYVYGSSITLNNTGATLTLSNYGSNGTDGSVICSVDYSSEGFPHGTGASICLSPLNLNINDINNAASWCTAVTTFNTGDLGTPGITNDNCQ